MFESAKITKSSARKSEATLSSEMDLDGEQTRAILFLLGIKSSGLIPNKVQSLKPYYPTA